MYKRQTDEHKYIKASVESAQTGMFVSCHWCWRHSCRLILSPGIMGALQWGETHVCVCVCVCVSGRPLSTRGEFLHLLFFSADFKPSVQPLLPAIGQRSVICSSWSPERHQSSSHPWSPAYRPEREASAFFPHLHFLHLFPRLISADVWIWPLVSWAASSSWHWVQGRHSVFFPSILPLSFCLKLKLKEINY